MSITFVEQYTTDDKSTWGDGPWQGEPDKVVWVDQGTNLDCMAHRNHAGAWCGYVGVPLGHRAFGRPYDDVNVVCHGGLTYAGPCQEGAGEPEHGICHIAQPGRPDEVWWLGFDCGHYMDFSPAMAARLAELRTDNIELDEIYSKADFLRGMRTPEETYRDLPYVVAEVTQLAAQLALIQ